MCQINGTHIWQHINNWIVKLFKTRMSKETQLSETAGAQVSSYIYRRIVKSVIWGKNYELPRWLRWLTSCKTMLRNCLKGDSEITHLYFLLSLSSTWFNHNIIIKIREGKLQEMESRAEKLEQGTVIFQVLLLHLVIITPAGDENWKCLFSRFQKSSRKAKRSALLDSVKSRLIFGTVVAISLLIFFAIIFS